MSTAALQGPSRESYAAVRETLSTLIRSGDADLGAVSEELFGVTALLDREGSLRRALTDPARTGDDRVGLARGLLGDQVGSATSDVVAWAVRARWSQPRDLADAMELLAVEAQVAAAERAGRLDSVEDELFRTARIVAGAPDLRSALSDRAAPVDSRAALLEGLLSDRASEETRRLARQAVVAPRGRTFDHAMTVYGRVAADRRSRLVATVTVTTPLTEEQRDRLTAVLTRIYGHEVHLNVQLDPALIGGIRVELGDEAIDGSVLARLDEARRRLAG